MERNKGIGDSKSVLDDRKVMPCVCEKIESGCGKLEMQRGGGIEFVATLNLPRYSSGKILRDGYQSPHENHGTQSNDSVQESMARRVQRRENHGTHKTIESMNRVRRFPRHETPSPASSVHAVAQDAQ